MDETVNVIAKLKDSVLCHAKMAQHGMKQIPIQITFSKKEIQTFHMVNITRQCGLVSESREPGVNMLRPTFKSVYYFQHLILQEFLAAVGLLTDIEQVRHTMNRAYERQLDIMIMFMAGLLGNNRTHEFSDSLQLKLNVSLDDLIELVVARERRNEFSVDNDQGRSTAHKASTLLLIMILCESRQVAPWRLMSYYILNGTGDLNLENQHISPTELRALERVLPTTDITSLK